MDDDLQQSLIIYAAQLPCNGQWITTNKKVEQYAVQCHAMDDDWKQIRKSGNQLLRFCVTLNSL